MYLVRDVFRTKPGKAKELVHKFKSAFKYLPKDGMGNSRILTDVVADYWTVVLELEVETLMHFENMSGFTSKPQVQEIMQGYMDLVKEGHREIFRIE
ncbi:MAG TPA: hypothetical protein VKA26_06130 [Ignavibacteriaceae bacterium]|nr:hypothetical protein [Ignavibacteriaceae bacterium]